jgi:predicted nuclease with TOPRIM domain
MTRKRQKEIALEIAKLNRKLEKCDNEVEKQLLERRLTALTRSIESFEDMIAIDELIQTKYKRILDK